MHNRGQKHHHLVSSIPHFRPQVLRDGGFRHIHAHVPGLSLAQVFFWSHNLESAEHISVLLPELLDVLLVVNLLSGEADSNGLHMATYKDPCRTHT